MAIPQIVQSITSIASAASPLTLTLPNPVNTANVLVCLIGWTGTASGVTQGAASFSGPTNSIDASTFNAEAWSLSYPNTGQSISIAWTSLGTGGTFPTVAVFEVSGSITSSFSELGSSNDTGSSSNLEVSVPQSSAGTLSALPPKVSPGTPLAGIGNESSLLFAIAVNDDFHPGTPTGSGSWTVDATNSSTPYGTVAHVFAPAGTVPSVDFGAVSSSAKHFVVLLMAAVGSPPAFIRQQKQLTLRADSNTFWANQGFTNPVLSTSTIIANVAGYQLTSIKGHSSATNFTKDVESVDTVTYEYYGSSVWRWENPTESTYDFTWAHNFADMQTLTPVVSIYEVVGLKSSALDITATQTTASPSTDLVVAAANPANGIGLCVAACTSQGAAHNTASIVGSYPDPGGDANAYGQWVRDGHSSSATYPNPATAHALIPSSNLLTADFLPTLGSAGNYHAVLATYLAAVQTISVVVNAIQITDFPRFYIDSSGTYTASLSYVPGNLNTSSQTFTAFQSYPKTVTYQCASSSDSLNTIWTALFTAINTNEGLSLTYSSPDSIGTSGATIGGIFP